MLSFPDRTRFGPLRLNRKRRRCRRALHDRRHQRQRPARYRPTQRRWLRQLRNDRPRLPAFERIALWLERHGSPNVAARDMLVKIDPTTAQVTPIGNFGLATGGTMADLSFDPTTGTLYGIGSVGGADLYSIDTTTGVATKVGDAGFTITEGGGVAVSPTGTVYGTPRLANFGTYDKTSGAYTDIANPAKPALGGYGALAFDGNTLYGLNLGGPPHLVTIDPTNGNVTDVVPTLTSLDAIAFRPGVPADYNGNGFVDAADYVLWRKGDPLQNEVDNPGTVSAADYIAWRERFGNGSAAASSLSTASVPEPATSMS